MKRIAPAMERLAMERLAPLRLAMKRLAPLRPATERLVPLRRVMEHVYKASCSRSNQSRQSTTLKNLRYLTSRGHL